MGRRSRRRGYKEVQELNIGDIEDVRNTLAGNTGLGADIEGQLIERVAQIELDSETIPGLRRGDWIGIGIAVAVSVFLFALCFAWA
jgi:hypothetical protein